MIENLHDGIQSVIKKFSTDYFLIHLDKKIKCVCHLEGSGQPDPKCVKCLGTGFKIYIRKVRGASQSSQLPTSMRAETKVYIAMNFYLLDNVCIAQDDILIKDASIYNVYQITRHTGFKEKYCYAKVACSEKKLDGDIFWLNFNKIISG